jgi:predicted neuraminidase
MKIVEQQLIFPLDAAPTPACHAATVAKHGGALYAAWFGGKEEGAGDVGIWLSARANGAWDKPVLMAAEPDMPHWNPVLFAYGQKLFLYYKKGVKIKAWRTFYRVWEHDLWSAERELAPGDVGGRGPVKNKPILLQNGDICAPASLEKHGWTAFVDRSRDGVVWQAQPPLRADAGLIQPTLWQDGQGVHAFLRSNAGRIYRSDSPDGASWGAAYPTDLPNNNSGIDCAVLGGALYLIYNPVGENWGARTPLAVAQSRDGGLTWPAAVTLEDAPGEYSYPSILSDGERLHAVYTFNRKSVMYVALEP